MASTMMAQNEVQNYGYNTRDELISGQGLTYNYDDIGNRTTAEGKTYTANELNQYTAIDSFTPQYDADGNQTLIKTSTGIWSVTYNAENRPVRWVKDNIVITMNFDRMGRRVFYKEEVAGVVTKHHKFVYDNYLCVQKLDALNNNAQINLFVWDPTEPVATRPLFTTGSGNRKFFYTCDGNKNVSELVHFETRNGIAAHYDYAPFGAVTRAISASAITDNTFTTDNPFRFSSEYHDDTLGLVYYNYRHYNPNDGRWCGRDPLDISVVLGAYCYLSNKTLNVVDMRGLDLLDPGRSAHSYMKDKSMYWHRVVNNAFEAWENWRSNVGGVAEAGEGLISKIKNSSGYINMLETTSSRLRELLKGKTHEELMLMNDTGGPFGAYTSNNAVGGISYWFNISNIRVNLREIDNNMCRLEYRVEGMFEFTDIYTFKWEKDLPIKTFFSDVIPSILAGRGTPYKIHGEWPEVFVLWWSN